MDEEYDVILEKTVRDLFKSSQLIQIKKYKMMKEKEIMGKNDELKQLILDKYTILINSVDALDQISSHLKEMQVIRDQLGNNINALDFDEIENKLSNVNFDENIIREDDNDNDYEIEEQIHQGHLCLNEKKYGDVIKILNEIKKHSSACKGFACDNYEYLKVELIEVFIKELLDHPKKLEDIDYYHKNFDLIMNELNLDGNCNDFLSKLYLSELYMKINYDDNISVIFNKFFINKSQQENIENIEKSMFSYNLMIRLLILKLSQCFVLLSKSKDAEFPKEQNKQCFIELYTIVLYIFKIVHDYQNDLLYDKTNQMKEFVGFIKGEITNNISSLIIIGKGSLSLHPKPVELVSFWLEVYNQLMVLTNANYTLVKELQLITTDNDSKGNLINMIFNNKVIDQLFNVLEYQMTYYTYENYSLNQGIESILNKKTSLKKENDIRTLLKTINSISPSSPFAIIKNKLITSLSDQLNNLLSKSMTLFKQNNEATNVYLTFIMKIFFHNDLIAISKELFNDHIEELITTIGDIYLKNNYSYIEGFMPTFEQYLFYETFSTEDTEVDSSIPSCSESLKELIKFLQSTEIKHSYYKLKVYNLIYDSYEKQLNVFIKENTLNAKLLIDLNLLKGIVIPSTDKEENITVQPKDFDSLIKVFIDAFNIQNMYKEDMGIIIIGKKELYSFFLDDNYYENDICFPVTRIQYTQKKERKEMINCINTKLHIYLIDKTLGGLNNQKKKTAISGNSTSKILEHRIDENYLSLRTTKTIQSTNNNTPTPPYQSQNSFLSGKFFNLNK